MEKELEYLYHYTSIENLALILKNRTIRLNPLDKMDDLQEQKTSDVENLGKFVFISSWTDDLSESIPMWRMYANPGAGVRIRLKKNPFLWHGTTASDVVRVTGIPLSPDTSPDAKVNSFLDLAKLMDLGFMSPQAFGGDILKKVNYTDDISKLEPKVVEQTNDGTSLKLGALGKHKSTYWAFQNEWRYIMTFSSMNFGVDIQAMERQFVTSMVKMIQGKENPPFRYFDLDIDPKCFEEMEITCSPQMTAGNRILLETIVERYNPKASIIESKLLGKI